MLRSIKYIIGFSALLFVLFPVATSAVTGSDWRAGNIIDDDVFYNNNDMSVADIQNFLNSKVTCDTWGIKSSEWGGGTRAQYGASKGYPAPYACLRDYSQDGKSAAQIIKEAADTHRISAKSLIVLLQKEQALITDEWPWPIQYRSATGYGCPDTAPCDAEYYGFRNQVMKAAYQFRRYATYPSEYRYKPYQTNYIQFNPNAGCSGTNVYIENLATAGLYNYTPYQPNTSALNNLYGSGDGCGAYGNRNFWRLFNDWFGSTKAASYKCDSKVSGVICVWSLLKTDGSQFLTPSIAERDNTIKNFGWKYEGVAFYASTTQRSGAVPVYRLRTDSKHYYTANTTERSTLLNSAGWVDEGISFYAHPSTASSNMSHQIYTLYNSTSGKHFFTKELGRKNLLVQDGYTLSPSSFRGLSNMADLPTVATNRVNIYRLRGLSSSYLYTTSISELESVIDGGFVYEGVVTTANATGVGTAVYRLRGQHGYFYTSNVGERDTAVKTFGMINEGVAYYLDNSSEQIYRLTNTRINKYLYTSSVNEALKLANSNGWLYEGSLISRTDNSSPVYRFLNLFNHRHFYTISLSEAARITNKGWLYETVAFSASPNTGLPVHRLLLHDKHLYTVSLAEKDMAISRFGYLYEGVSFYVSQSTTTSPVFRLQGGNDEYFYTSSAAERDVAMSKFGYTYEGHGFYLPLE